jgi:hypothetical protein
MNISLEALRESVNPYIPLIYVFISGFGYSIQSLVVKLLEIDHFYNSFQVVFCRGIAQVTLSTVVLYFDANRQSGNAPKLCGDTRKVASIMLLRSIVGYGGIAFSYLALERLPVGDGAVLTMLSPLFASILGYLALSEPWRLSESAATIVSLVGATLVAKPTAIFGQASNEEALDAVGVVYALIASVSAGCAFVLVRVLGTTSKMPWQNICLLQGATQMLLSVPLAFAFHQTLTLDLTLYQTALLLSGCVIGAFSQAAMTIGMQREKSSRASAMRMSDVIFAYIWQMCFTRDSFSVLSVIGATLVTGSIIIIVFTKPADVKEIIDKRSDDVTLNERSNNTSSSVHNIIELETIHQDAKVAVLPPQQQQESSSAVRKWSVHNYFKWATSAQNNNISISHELPFTSKGIKYSTVNQHETA